MSKTRESRVPAGAIGVNLRGAHAGRILADRPPVGFFEVISENYMGHHGPSQEFLDRIADNWPVVLHGVSLSIGSTDPLDLAYLKELGRLADRVRAPWVSDHICWTGVGGRNSHDLLPLPYDEATLRHVAARVREVSDRLGRPLVLENPSSYIAYRDSTMAEAEWVARLLDQADCGLLLDVNNVWVSAHNQGFDPTEYVDAMPAGRVVEVHIAGHVDQGDHLLDTHSRPVADAVWQLYRRFIERTGPRPTLLEWEDEVPDFDTLWREAQKALQYHPEGSHAV